MAEDACLLLLIPTTSYQAHDFLEAANRLGATVAVGSEESHLLKSDHSRLVEIDLVDLEKSVESIARFARRHPVLAVFGVDDRTAGIAASAAERLGLPHNAPAAVLQCNNKYLFRQALTEARLWDEPFTLIDRTADVSKQGRGLEYPVVLKPLALSGSRGVIRVNNDNEFGSAVHRIGKILDSETLPIPPEERRYILAESYLPGNEVAVDGIISEGVLDVLAIFDKPDPLEGPYFEETIYVTPSRHPPEVLAALQSDLAEVIRALDIRNGPIHAEFRLNDKGARIIEMSPRSIGGLCGQMLHTGLGMSLEELVLRQALGKEVRRTGKSDPASAVMMIPTPRAGILKAVRGRKTAEAVPGITKITLTVPIGKEVIPLPEGNRYLGFIFSEAPTADAAEKAVREAYDALDIEISVPSGETVNGD